MITIEKIADQYEAQYGEEVVEGLRSEIFNDMDFKEQFEFIEQAGGRNMVIEYDDDVLDGGKLTYSGEKDKDFDFLQLLKDIETDD